MMPIRMSKVVVGDIEITFADQKKKIIFCTAQKEPEVVVYRGRMFLRSALQNANFPTRYYEIDPWKHPDQEE